MRTSSTEAVARLDRLAKPLTVTGVAMAAIAAVVWLIELPGEPQAVSPGSSPQAWLTQLRSTASIVLTSAAGVLLAGAIAAGLATAAWARTQRRFAAGRWHQIVLIEEVGDTPDAPPVALDGPEVASAAYARWRGTVIVVAVLGAIAWWALVPSASLGELYFTWPARLLRVATTLVGVLWTIAFALIGCLIVAATWRRHSPQPPA